MGSENWTIKEEAELMRAVAALRHNRKGAALLLAKQLLREQEAARLAAEEASGGVFYWGKKRILLWTAKAERLFGKVSATWFWSLMMLLWVGAGKTGLFLLFAASMQQADSGIEQVLYMLAALGILAAPPIFSYKILRNFERALAVVTERE